MLSSNCPKSISQIHGTSEEEGEQTERRQIVLELLLGTLSKSEKPLDKFSVQIMNEKEHRQTRKAALLSSVPHSTSGGQALSTCRKRREPWTWGGGELLRAGSIITRSHISHHKARSLNPAEHTANTDLLESNETQHSIKV